jgi:hypothetical protein
MEVNAMPKPSEKEMEREMERVEGASGLPGTLPFKEYAKEEKLLTHHIERLEKEYDEREKVIGRIMEYGTGIESEKALRMYSTGVLERWEASLEENRRAKAKQ